MINYGKQLIDKNDINEVVSALESDWLTQGERVEKFEKDLSNFFGSSNACALSNGTAALHLTGIALNWGKDDIIITSPITFLATANSIVYSGAQPDLVDIEDKTYTINPNKVEDKIKLHIKNGKKVKAIIGVDFAGLPCDWSSLREIADKYEIKLINDNCHAMGAKYKEDIQYAAKFADYVTQSFHPVKHITTGEGGAIMSNDEDFDRIVKKLRSHGMTKNNSEMQNNDGPWYYEMHELGFNYRITDFQCALGSSQLKKLNTFIKKRRKIADIYNENFDNVDSLTIPYTQKNQSHAYHLYPLLIDFMKYDINKKLLFHKMKESGINLQVHYIPIHFQPYYQKNYNFKKGDFPNAEDFYYQEVSLPIFPSLDFAKQEKVINSLKSILSL